MKKNALYKRLILTRFVVLTFFLFSFTVLNAQTNPDFHILFEGTYPIDGDSALYSTLDWYGFYVSDPYKKGDVPKSDTFEKVQLKIQYQPTLEASPFSKTKPSTISTANPKKSLFLLGVSRGTQLNFKSDYRCGGTSQYTYQQASLLPGRWIEWGFPTMSCSHLSIYAAGNVTNMESYLKITDYKITVELLASTASYEKRTQEITSDIFDQKNPWHGNSLDVPCIYATGDFDIDATTDFILWHGGSFYLYLSRYAKGKNVVGLVAKSKLQKPINASYGELPESWR